MVNNVLGAHEYFSTTQPLLAHLTRQSKLVVFQDIYIFFQKYTYLPWEERKVTPIKMAKLFCTIGVREGILLGGSEKICPENNNLP